MDGLQIWRNYTLGGVPALNVFLIPSVFSVDAPPPSGLSVTLSVYYV